MNITKRGALFVSIILIFIPTVQAQTYAQANEYFRLAERYKNNSNIDSAEIYFEKAGKLYREDKKFDEAVNSFNQIGIILTRKDNYVKAKLFLDQALSLTSKLDINSLTTATTYIAMGVLYGAEENYKESLIYHHKALTIRLLKLGKYNAEVATSYGNIGNIYLRNKTYDLSIQAHLEAMIIREKLFGKESVEVNQTYINLGNVYRAQKQYKIALEYLQKALANKVRQLGTEHKDVAKLYLSISEIYYLMDDKENGDLYKSKSRS